MFSNGKCTQISWVFSMPQPGVCLVITWNYPKKLEKPWITKGLATNSNLQVLMVDSATRYPGDPKKNHPSKVLLGWTICDSHKLWKRSPILFPQTSPVDNPQTQPTKTRYVCPLRKRNGVSGFTILNPPKKKLEDFVDIPKIALKKKKETGSSQGANVGPNSIDLWFSWCPPKKLLRDTSYFRDQCH